MGLDLFGNKRYINMIGGAVTGVTPAPDGFYLPSEIVHPLITANGNQGVIIAGINTGSGMGLAVFSFDAETGLVSAVKSLANGSGGSFYSRGVYAAPDKKLMIYGSTNGTVGTNIQSGSVNPNNGALDYFAIKIVE